MAQQTSAWYIRVNAFAVLLFLVGGVGFALTLVPRPASETVPFYLPLTAALAVPLAVAIVRLGRKGADRMALHIVRVVSALLAAAITIALVSVPMAALKDGGEFAGLALFFMVLLGWPVLLLAVAFVVLLVRLSVAADRAAATATAWRDGAVVGRRVLLASLACLAVPATALVADAGGRAAGAALTPEAPRYSDRIALRRLGETYNCLWAHAGADTALGFPASLDAVAAAGKECARVVATPGPSDPGAAVALEYRPMGLRPEGGYARFALLARDARLAPGAGESMWLDDTGLLRRAAGAPAASDTTSRVDNDYVCFLVKYLVDDLREYAAIHPMEGYPTRLADAPGGAALRNFSPGTMGVKRDFRYYGAPKNPQYSRDGTTTIDYGRVVLTYRPTWMEESSRRITGFSLALTHTAAGRAMPEDADARPTLVELRNYYADGVGPTRATGAPRPATAQDRPVSCLDAGN